MYTIFLLYLILLHTPGFPVYYSIYIFLCVYFMVFCVAGYMRTRFTKCLPYSFSILHVLFKYVLCLLRYSISFYCSFLFIYYVFCYFSLQSTYIKVSLYIFLYVKHSFIIINYLCDLIFIFKIILFIILNYIYYYHNLII